jgi:hypothetical protein
MLFSPAAVVFKMAGSVWSLKHKCSLVTLIIRAKKNCVAYFEAEKVTERKQGRPAIYGEKVKLMELFDHKDEFAKMQCSVYGKVEEVLITSVDLLWKPTGTLIRFVLAVTSRGPIVLMCSDLSQEPVAALQLYCARVRIETMFDMLKNLIGAFRYRFWSKRLARHSRKPRKNETLRKPSQKRIESVRRCHDAYERFVMVGAVTLGLLQLIALKFQGTIWNHFEGFLRTRSRQLPSERTVKSVISNLLVKNLIDSAPDSIMREIQERYDSKQTEFQRAVSSSE